jgi:hypothetical protein
MGIRNDAKEIAKLSALADNEQVTPLVQITAARKLLRFTEFSARSCRVGKRVANRWLAAEAVSQSVRNRAALLLNFTLERKLDPTEEAAEPTATPGSSAAPQHLPADFNKPYFSKMSHDYADVEALAALAATAYERFGTQPTHRKNEQGVWERTPAYQQARAEHSAAIVALHSKENARGN